MAARVNSQISQPLILPIKENQKWKICHGYSKIHTNITYNVYVHVTSAYVALTLIRFVIGWSQNILTVVNGLR